MQALARVIYDKNAINKPTDESLYLYFSVIKNDSKNGSVRRFRSLQKGHYTEAKGQSLLLSFLPHHVN